MTLAKALRLDWVTNQVILLDATPTIAGSSSAPEIGLQAIRSTTVHLFPNSDQWRPMALEDLTMAHISSLWNAVWPTYT